MMSTAKCRICRYATHRNVRQGYVMRVVNTVLDEGSLSTIAMRTCPRYGSEPRQPDGMPSVVFARRPDW